MAKTASTSAANPKQSGSVENTKANKSSNQKFESTTTDKSKHNAKSLDKQKPERKPKLPPDRHIKQWKFLLVVVLFAPIRGGSLGVCYVGCMLYGMVRKH